MTVEVTKPHVVLTDIEGTTTPISFVKETLFPFARGRIADYVRAHRAELSVAQIVADASGGTGDVAQAIAVLLAWSDADTKIAPLKSLQGLIWEDGYREGLLKAPVFPDAAAALRAWHSAGIKLAVYSSGSVLAQKRLFTSSDQGNLATLFNGFFDTAIGAKREAAAYARIARDLAVAPGDILFLSDVPEELDAATSAGVHTLHLVRPGEGAQATTRHAHVASFAEIAWA